MGQTLFSFSGYQLEAFLWHIWNTLKRFKDFGDPDSNSNALSFQTWSAYKWVSIHNTHALFLYWAVICSFDLLSFQSVHLMGSWLVTSTKMTWPPVNPRSTTLLDRTCKPKLTDDSRVLFEFGLNTCNTTVMVWSHLKYKLGACGV